MNHFKRFFFFLIVYIISISCGKNDQTPAANTNQKSDEETTKTAVINTNTTPEISKKDTAFLAPTDSIRAIKESVLKKKNTKKKETTKKTNNKTSENSVTETTSGANKKIVIPSFVYIKKILSECKIGVPMTQKELKTNFNIPEEGIQLVKSVTKISENELEVKWKSTWLIEKMSDAKFNDGRLKVRFEKNKMYTSGGAIGIKYEKKMYTDLYLIGRSAYIPTVKGYYWQIGKD